LTWIILADALQQYLIEGDYLGFVTACYTQAIGQGFFAIVALAMFGVLYNRTKSIALCSIVWLLTGSSLIAAFNIISPLAVILVSVGLTGIVYGVFGRSSK